MAAVTINALDAGNPLFLQNNDHSNVPLIGFKLTGTENYKMWSTAMKIALTGKNKFGFVDGTCVKPVTSHVLAQQWERCNSIVLGWILSSLSPDLCLGQVYSQIAFENIRSNILARDPLPDVKEAFNVVSREESHRGLHPRTGSGSGNKVQPAAFVVKSNNNSANRGPNPNLLCKKYGLIGHTIERCYEIIGYLVGFKKNPNLTQQGGNSFSNSNGKVYNNNTEASKGASTSSGSTSFDTQFTKEQMMKILSLINEKLSGNANANMAGMRPTFFNGNVLFNMHFEKFFCAQTYSYMYNLTLGWIIDSRANQHLTNSTKDKLTANVLLFDVLVIPDYNVSLMSVHKLIKDSKLFVGFDETKCYIQDLNLVKTLGTSSKADGLYLFDVDQIGKSIAGSANSTFVCHVSKQLWHSRLGHHADHVLSVLSKSIGLKYEKHGPYRVISRDCYKYFLTIVDDYSRAVRAYLIKSKDEVTFFIESFVELIYTQFNKRIKVFRSDNGTEFVNNKLGMLFKEKGIIHQTFCAHTPQQNGIAERKHRHLLNVARGLMFQGGIPLNMWSECILTVVYLINRLPSSVLSGASPYLLVYGKEPSLSHIRCFGCLCYSIVLNNNDKFSSRSEKCILIGFSGVKKAYKLYSLKIKKTFFSRDVTFYETIFPLKMKHDSLNDKYVSHKYESELNLLNFFDNSNDPAPKVPNDDEREHSTGDGNVMASHDVNSSHHVDENATFATPLNENNSSSEGQQSDPIPPRFNSESLSSTNFGDEPQTVRRSDRVRNFPPKYNDYNLPSNKKYGIEKHVNYSKLSVFDGAFGGVGDEEVVVGECVVVTSLSQEMLTNSCLGGIMVNLIFLEWFEEEALVEFMVE
ncbi:putative RNA-directed DNA polymerase [Tanacetum coccineum]|uniref:RNA-directed DNA polymerase n=1 Tax=Tanacetum coccineum TaxID=301880 RepID=A0ABQ5H1N8_9ASTR